MKSLSILVALAGLTCGQSVWAGPVRLNVPGKVAVERLAKPLVAALREAGLRKADVVGAAQAAPAGSAAPETVVLDADSPSSGPVHMSALEVGLWSTQSAGPHARRIELDGQGAVLIDYPAAGTTGKYLVFSCEGQLTDSMSAVIYGLKADGTAAENWSRSQAQPTQNGTRVRFVVDPADLGAGAVWVKFQLSDNGWDRGWTLQRCTIERK